jgi:hypothetical protein
MPPEGMFSVGQLISEDALPDWVRDAAPSAAANPPDAWGSPAAAWPGSDPNAPGSAPAPGANAAALFDEAALPEWLRAAADRQPLDAHVPGMGQPGAPSVLPYGGGGMFSPAPAPAYPGYPGMAGTGQPVATGSPMGMANGMSGQSLLDASSLPAWLGGDGQPSGGPASAGPLGGGGLAANSLVDENALPEWMRQEAGQPPADAMPAAGTVSQWLAGPVTDEPLPGFLDQMYASADVPRLEPASPWSAAPQPAGDPRLGPMPAGQLVDPNALPDWLRAQPGMAGPGGPAMPYAPMPAPSGFPSGNSGYGGPAPAPNGGPAEYAFNAPPPAAPVYGGFSAADLIEPGAMNAWEPAGRAPASAAVFNSTTGWTFGEASQLPPGVGLAAAPGPGGAPSANGAAGWGGMAGALPDWLDPRGSLAPSGLSTAGQSPSGSWPGSRAGRPPIAEDELPDWLRGGAADERAGGSAAGAAPEGGSGLNADPYAGSPMDDPYVGSPLDDALLAAGGYDGAAEFDDGALPADGDAAAHYTDRFGSEMPGNAGQFGYAYDYGDPSQPGGSAADAAPAEPPAKRKRKGFFRRG